MIRGYMKVIEQVKDTQTGNVFERVSDAPLFDDNDGPHIFYWEEGNMECDCNRGRICEVYDAPCNAGTRRFLLNLLDENRTVLYSEFELPHNTTSEPQ